MEADLSNGCYVTWLWVPKAKRQLLCFLRPCKVVDFSYVTCLNQMKRYSLLMKWKVLKALLKAHLPERGVGGFLKLLLLKTCLHFFPSEFFSHFSQTHKRSLYYLKKYTVIKMWSSWATQTHEKYSKSLISEGGWGVGTSLLLVMSCKCCLKVTKLKNALWNSLALWKIISFILLSLYTYTDPSRQRTNSIHFVSDISTNKWSAQMKGFLNNTFLIDVLYV